MSVRKAHNAGRNHLRNVVEYYQRACAPRRRAAQDADKRQKSATRRPSRSSIPSLHPMLQKDKQIRCYNKPLQAFHRRFLASQVRASLSIPHQSHNHIDLCPGMPPPPFGMPGAPPPGPGGAVPPPGGRGMPFPPFPPNGVPPPNLPNGLPFPPPPGGFPPNFQLPPPGGPGGFPPPLPNQQGAPGGPSPGPGSGPNHSQGLPPPGFSMSPPPGANDNRR